MLASLFYWCCSIGLTKKWMRLMKYEGECIKICNESNHTKLHSFGGNKCSYPSFAYNIWLNWQNDEQEWWSMNVIASKICHESNHKKIVFNRKTSALTLIFTTMLYWLNLKINDWEWYIMKVNASKIFNGLNHTKLYST